MSHLKRQKVPKNWPIPRKGTAFVVKPSSNMKTGIPILIVLRDMLKICQNRREVKRALHEKNILINEKISKDEKQSVTIGDIIGIVPEKKSYKLGLKNNGKFNIEEISEKEAGKKSVKVIGKKILKGKKIQLNLIDGRNFLTDLKCSTNDSVLIDFKENKIEKCLALREKANALIFAGKHAGKKGIIEKLDLNKKMATIKNKDGTINVLIKQLMAVE
jgi:small subunit ribosomal protein S4e